MIVVKALVGVRTSTQPALFIRGRALVREKQAKFLCTMKHQLDLHDDLLGYILRLTQHKNQVMTLFTWFK